MKTSRCSPFLTVAYLGLACLLQSCPSSKEQVYSLTGATKGTWEWVKTTTPTRTLTPQSVGYTRQLAILSDQQGAYVGFYRNDTLQRRIDETSSDTLHTLVDTERSTVLIKYKGAGYLKYGIANTANKNQLTISELLNPYSPQADTVHSLYQRSNLILYPY